jgi:hypothetical protein
MPQWWPKKSLITVSELISFNSGSDFASVSVYAKFAMTFSSFSPNMPLMSRMNSCCSSIPPLWFNTETRSHNILANELFNLIITFLDSVLNSLYLPLACLFFLITIPVLCTCLGFFLRVLYCLVNLFANSDKLLQYLSNSFLYWHRWFGKC